MNRAEGDSCFLCGGYPFEDAPAYLRMCRSIELSASATGSSQTNAARQLMDIRTAQLNQERLVIDRSRSVQASFTKLLAFVARQIRDLETAHRPEHRAGPAVA